MDFKNEVINDSDVKNYMYIFFKRVFDIVVSLLAVICSTPFYLVFFFIYLFGQNKGPMFYKQERVGKNGRKFNILKFRSMIVDADQKLKQNEQLYKKYIDNGYKLPDGEDPRVTSFGRIIRRSSLDEIPQFVNVLKGDMSIIGPRPIVEDELVNYQSQERIDKFLSVTPGAMGYWQASGRSNVTYPERCDVELYYVDHASFWFDLKILFKNVISIFKHDGAF